MKKLLIFLSVIFCTIAAYSATRVTNIRWNDDSKLDSDLTQGKTYTIKFDYTTNTNESLYIVVNTISAANENKWTKYYYSSTINLLASKTQSKGVVTIPANAFITPKVRIFVTATKNGNIETKLHDNSEFLYANIIADSTTSNNDDSEAIVSPKNNVSKELDFEPEDVELDQTIELLPKGPSNKYQWSYAPNYSDEFKGPLNKDKWDFDLPDWGTTPCWIFSQDNASIKDGNLCLKVTSNGAYIDPYCKEKERTLYLKSGAARSWKVVTYGYFECRMKSTDLIPGTCPAFWMYSKGGYQDVIPCNRSNKKVMYSEIDGIEVGQTFADKKRVLRTYEMNLHTYCNPDGNGFKWIRGVAGGNITHGRWISDDTNFDIRKDYHTYGIWNRSDSIIWYVDGVKLNAKKNIYWHLPMRLIVSLGIRPPYARLEGGAFQPIDPTKVSGYTMNTFPQEMKVDYIRSWKLLPQIISYNNLNKLTHINPSSNSVTFDGNFNAGSGCIVCSDNGITMSLVEKNESGQTIRIVKSTNKESTKGKELGPLNMTLSLNGVSNPTNGHYYDIELSMKSESISMTKDGNVKKKISEYTLTHNGTKNRSLMNIGNLKTSSTLQFSIDKACNVLYIDNNYIGNSIKVYSLEGLLLICKDYSSSGLDISSLQKGIYVLKVDNIVQNFIIK